MRSISFVLLAATACASRAPAPPSQTTPEPAPAAPDPEAICRTGHDVDETSSFWAGRDASGAIKVYAVSPTTKIMDVPGMYYDAAGKFIAYGMGGEMPPDRAVIERIEAQEKAIRAGLTFEELAFHCAARAPT